MAPEAYPEPFFGFPQETKNLKYARLHPGAFPP